NQFLDLVKGASKRICSQTIANHCGIPYEMFVANSVFKLAIVRRGVPIRSPSIMAISMAFFINGFLTPNY
ncbi:MAG: hypothetical protein VXW36_02290, partial [Candidatus Thermoplasmatota archaeon]|nr:hypothetical protein [Candidatus Thermoplasmatota archaeon]